MMKKLLLSLVVVVVLFLAARAVMAIRGNKAPRGTYMFCYYPKTNLYYDVQKERLRELTRDN